MGVVQKPVNKKTEKSVMKTAETIFRRKVKLTLYRGRNTSKNYYTSVLEKEKVWGVEKMLKKFIFN